MYIIKTLDLWTPRYCSLPRSRFCPRHATLPLPLLVACEGDYTPYNGIVRTRQVLAEELRSRAENVEVKLSNLSRAFGARFSASPSKLSHAQKQLRHLHGLYIYPLTLAVNQKPCGLRIYFFVRALDDL